MSNEKQSELNRASLLVAFAAAIGMFVGPTPMASAVASLFMVPLSKEFDLSRTMISAILLVQPITVAIFSASCGRALDRFGVRPVLLPIIILFAIGMFAMGLVQNVWQMVAVYVVLGICVSVHCYSSYTKVISLWFSQHRGLVMGTVITLGSGLGATIVPQFVRGWIEEYGWRGAYFGLAGVILVLGFPILFFFLREPAFARVQKQVAGVTESVLAGLTRTEAMKTRTFWLIFCAIIFAPMAIVGTIAHSVAMLTERGFDSGTAVTALSSVYIGGMMGYLSSGYLLDKVQTPKIVLPYFTAALCGVAILHSTTSASMLVPGAILLGLGQGSEMQLAAYLTSRFFGLKAYGAIYGSFYAAGNIGIATGIMTMGIAHDMAGGYAPMKYVFIGCLVMVLILLGSLGAYVYKRPTETDAAAGEAEAVKA
ncbi:MAG: MFS transporter [Steroidobacteraceae bacterium]